MADFHFHVTQVKRSNGASVMEYAAYRACEKLQSDYYNETYDYTSKKGLIISEILLPSYVPNKYKDRKTLWDDVEENEKRSDAQLAFNFDFSLMNEFTIEENIEIARRFILENFVARGMICDWAFHFPSQGDKNENPHIHMLCPIRPMKTDGTWGNKQCKDPVLDEDGNPVLDKNGNKKYSVKKTTDWSDVDTLNEWRKAWAKINNDKFEEKGMEQRIYAESYEDQGMNLLPTIHEGPAVRAMEAKGMRTDKGDFNRAVRRANEVIKIIHNIIAELFDWIKDTGVRLIKQPVLSDVRDYYTAKNNFYHNAVPSIAWDGKETVEYIRKNKISTYEDYANRFDSVKADYDNLSAEKKSLKSDIASLDSKLKSYDRFRECKTVYDVYQMKKFKSFRNAFYNENKKQIDKYYAITKKYPEFLDAGFSKKTITDEIEEKQKQVDQYNKQLEPIKYELTILKRIKTAHDALAGTSSEARVYRIDGLLIYIKKRREDVEEPDKKPSTLEKLKQANEKVKENDRQKVTASERTQGLDR